MLHYSPYTRVCASLGRGGREGGLFPSVRGWTHPLQVNHRCDAGFIDRPRPACQLLIGSLGLCYYYSSSGNSPMPADQALRVSYSWACYYNYVRYTRGLACTRYVQRQVDTVARGRLVHTAGRSCLDAIEGKFVRLIRALVLIRQRRWSGDLSPALGRGLGWTLPAR